MQKLFQVRQMPPDRLVLESHHCKVCGEAATAEMSIEMEQVIAVRRYCSGCLANAQY